jgi:hypothetical protein
LARALRLADIATQRGRNARAHRLLVAAQRTLTDYEEDIAASGYTPPPLSPQFDLFLRHWRSDWSGLPASEVQRRISIDGVDLDVRTVRTYMKSELLSILAKPKS